MLSPKHLIALETKVELLLHHSKNSPTLKSKEELRDFRTFIQYFYKLRTGRDYIISRPVNREPHQMTLANLVPKIVNHELNRIMINMPPRYGKTEWAIHLMAYGIAFYPGSNYIYTSFSADLATKQTATIRQIISMPEFEKIFGVCLDPTSKRKDDFMTNTGCRVVGAGAGGTITGNGAGIRGSDEFGGFIILDDMHKPIEITHENHRTQMKDWYKNTLLSRVNNPHKTPIISIGQILHEDDNNMNLQRVKREPEPEFPLDTYQWYLCILEGLDGAGNALDPDMHTPEKHHEMCETMPYMWWSQYQQRPQPAGGGIFKKEWFKLLDEDPEIICTFITVDTAETSKTWNDATVLSFWGLYKAKTGDWGEEKYALHWLDCWEIRVEPHELQSKFDQFYMACCRYKVKPSVVGIEKKSTGATVLSVLNTFQGIRVVDTIDYRIDPLLKDSLKRCKKVDRFLSCQQYVSNKLITFTNGIKHASMCIEHLSKITANDSHAFDDIADTMADAIYMALITGFVPSLKTGQDKPKAINLGRSAIKW